MRPPRDCVGRIGAPSAPHSLKQGLKGSRRGDVRDNGSRPTAALPRPSRPSSLVGTAAAYYWLAHVLGSRRGCFTAGPFEVATSGAARSQSRATGDISTVIALHDSPYDDVVVAMVNARFSRWSWRSHAAGQRVNCQRLQRRHPRRDEVRDQSVRLVNQGLAPARGEVRRVRVLRRHAAVAGSGPSCSSPRRGGCCRRTRRRGGVVHHTDGPRAPTVRRARRAVRVRVLRPRRGRRQHLRTDPHDHGDVRSPAGSRAVRCRWRSCWRTTCATSRPTEIRQAHAGGPARRPRHAHRLPVRRRGTGPGGRRHRDPGARRGQLALLAHPAGWSHPVRAVRGGAVGRDLIPVLHAGTGRLLLCATPGARLPAWCSAGIAGATAGCQGRCSAVGCSAECVGRRLGRSLVVEVSRSPRPAMTRRVRSLTRCTACVMPYAAPLPAALLSATIAITPESGNAEQDATRRRARRRGRTGRRRPRAAAGRLQRVDDDRDGRPQAEHRSAAAVPPQPASTGRPREGRCRRGAVESWSARSRAPTVPPRSRRVGRHQAARRAEPRVRSPRSARQTAGLRVVRWRSFIWRDHSSRRRLRAGRRGRRRGAHRTATGLRSAGCGGSGGSRAGTVALDPPVLPGRPPSSRADPGPRAAGGRLRRDQSHLGGTRASTLRRRGCGR